jgi:hypothetical protein
MTGTIAAGAKLKTHWAQWTHRPTTFLVYMAKCPDKCDSWDGTGKVRCKYPCPALTLASLTSNVVKIFQQGLISGTANAGVWAGDAIVDTLTATVTIPAALAPGEYLIRHELIALHQAKNPQCTLSLAFKCQCDQSN